MFRLESVSQKKCLSASSGLSLTSCEPPSAALLWKWVSRHRLFNLGTSRCLGINMTNLPQPDVGIFECDVSLPTMWWRCGGSMLYGAMNNKLVVVDSRVMVKKSALYQWRIYGAAGEGPCAYPYEGKRSDTFHYHILVEYMNTFITALFITWPNYVLIRVWVCQLDLLCI